MKRLLFWAVIRLCGEAVLLTLVTGILIGLLGYLNQWDTSYRYSNAFFIAGCLLIIGGAFSRHAAGLGWESYERLSAESFRDMSPGERANHIVNESSSIRLVILGLVSGIALIIISLLVWDLF